MMNRKSSLASKFPYTVSGLFLTLTLLATLLLPAPAFAQTESTMTTYVVQPGDTLTRIANGYGVTVEAIVGWNEIENQNLILVGQELILYVPEDGVPLAPPPVPAVDATGGPLAFTWAVIDWQPADPDYIATIEIVPQGGQPPYTFYHDGLVQEGEQFEIAWLRCLPKPGSVGLADATGEYVKEEYWLLAPYCPVGVEIDEPAEGAHLKHMPRHFNVTWEPTVDPAPYMYGMEIEVWQDGSWRPWQTYKNFRGERFFVPDVFPGDLGGRLRMWGIYEWSYEGPKTPWRYFEFRVTY
jgi:LysM repeat protein